MTWKQITQNNSHPIGEGNIPSASAVHFPPEPAGLRAGPGVSRDEASCKERETGTHPREKAEQRGVQLLFYFSFRCTVLEIKY